MTLHQRFPRRLAAACAAAYVLTWFGVGFLPLPGTDLDQFFRPSAEAMLRHPLLPYTVAGQSAYPNANGPLALVPLAVVVCAERALGVSTGHLSRALILAAFSGFLLLMGLEGLRAVERVQGRLSPRARLLAVGLLVLGPTIWQGDGGYGHIEQPIETWLILLAARWVQARMPARAGVAVGLALLARTPAVLFLLPLAIAAGRSRRAGAARLLVAAAATACAGVVPFLLADRADVVHSLVTYRAALRVGLGSIWTLTRGTSLEDFAQHADAVFIVAAAIGSTLWLARSRQGLAGAGLYAALGLAAAAFALLAKTVWPYYFLEVYVLWATWAMARPPRSWGFRRWLAVGLVVVAALIAEVGATPGIPDPVDRLEGAVGFALLTTAGLLILRLAAVSTTEAEAG